MENYNWPLIGHQHIKDYFAKAFAAGKIHHAYLFEGPEQIGKMTFARMLAKTLLCEEFVLTPLSPPLNKGGKKLVIPPLNKGGKKLAPCGSCRACQAYKNNAHPDYLALTPGEDAHISIETTRGFISSLATRPLLGRWRIGIIEKTALLTAEATNALLKTLEEPGKQVVLFLIAQETVLPTVASRCQRIQFGFVPTAEIERSLEGVLGASEIARLAAGCPGRALAFQDPIVYKLYQEAIQEVVSVLAKEEGEKLIWVAEHFGKRGDMKDKREDCREFLSNMQMVLRKRLISDFTATALLKKTMQAELLIRSNVDPRLVCEYLLLNHDTRIP